MHETGRSQKPYAGVALVLCSRSRLVKMWKKTFTTAESRVSQSQWNLCRCVESRVVEEIISGAKVERETPRTP